MTTTDIQRLALVLSKQAEIEAMKAENRWLKYDGKQVSSTKKDLISKADELKQIAYMTDSEITVKCTKEYIDAAYRKNANTLCLQNGLGLMFPNVKE